MASVQTLTSLHRQPLPQEKRAGVKVLEQEIVYISGHASCEQTVIEDFLGTLFARTVLGYIWEQQELKDSLGTTDPALIILSEPLGSMIGLRENIWDIVREIHPNVPLIWLAPDSNDIPDFLPPSNASGVWVLPIDAHLNAMNKFIAMVAEVLGVEPPIRF